MTTSLIFGDNKQKVVLAKPEAEGSEVQSFTLIDNKVISLVINQVTGDLEASNIEDGNNTNFSKELQGSVTSENILDIKYKNKESAEVAELSIITDTVDMFLNEDNSSKSKITIGGLLLVSITIPFDSSQEAEVRIKVEKNNDKYQFTLSTKDSDGSSQPSEGSDVDVS